MYVPSKSVVCDVCVPSEGVVCDVCVPSEGVVCDVCVPGEGVVVLVFVLYWCLLKVWYSALYVPG